MATKGNSDPKPRAPQKNEVYVFQNEDGTVTDVVRGAPVAMDHLQANKNLRVEKHEVRTRSTMK